MSAKRMSSSDRRLAILEAVTPVFAQHGFEGATTRRLAAAAGVSEALLYRHFPSKNALYREIGAAHLRSDERQPGIEALLAMPASTERLVSTVHYLIEHFADAEADSPFPRLMARSLLDDGSFAAAVFEEIGRDLAPFVEEALAAAREQGDLETVAGDGDQAALWLVQQLGFGLRLFSLPERAVVPWRGGRRSWVDAAVRFALRGVGLSQAAVARCYDPDSWRRHAE
jgi:AcrR family transcriptional regulator